MPRITAAHLKRSLIAGLVLLSSGCMFSWDSTTGSGRRESLGPEWDWLFGDWTGRISTLVEETPSAGDIRMRFSKERERLRLEAFSILTDGSTVPSRVDSIRIHLTDVAYSFGQRSDGTYRCSITASGMWYGRVSGGRKALTLTMQGILTQFNLSGAGTCKVSLNGRTVIRYDWTAERLPHSPPLN